jgi:hypothetical protein
MSLVGHQINPIDVNFHPKKSLEIFDKNSVDKVQGRKWLPNTVLASSNTACRHALPLPGGAFYSVKICLDNCPPCPLATYVPEV